MKKLRILVAVILFKFFISACEKQGSSTSETETDPQVIAEVNSEKITRARFDRFMKMERFNYQMSVLGMIGDMQGDNPDLNISPEISPEVEEQLQEGLFEQMVNMILINQEGAQKKISIKNEELDAEYNKMLESRGQEGYDEWLQGTGLDDSDTKYILKTQLIYEKLVSDLKKQVKVSDEELRAYYNENRAQQLEISHILVEEEAEAVDIIRQLKNGADFAQMARGYSTCPSKNQGGYLDSAGTGKWVEPFELAALQLKAGEITEQPVKSEFGYHIIKADAAKTFESSRNSLVLELQKVKEQEAQQNLMLNMRENAVIIDYRTESGQ